MPICLDLNDPDGNLKKLMRLYLMIHCDHEGGNASAFTSLTLVQLSLIYIMLFWWIKALAGPLHGLANQECLKFVLEIRESLAGLLPGMNWTLCWDRLRKEELFLDMVMPYCVVLIHDYRFYKFW
ncbi:MAG: hypothetical protein CM1200mP10_09240 [Candidatus Neomarinimicrobiota bacterium]|nr:MAG: hypothetical protein CM1200mP10_09240 [Candidatus Neomarinimicrobiota bacterium]